MFNTTLTCLQYISRLVVLNIFLFKYVLQLNTLVGTYLTCGQNEKT